MASGVLLEILPWVVHIFMNMLSLVERSGSERKKITKLVRPTKMYQK